MGGARNINIWVPKLSNIIGDECGINCDQISLNSYCSFEREDHLDCIAPLSWESHHHTYKVQHYVAQYLNSNSKSTLTCGQVSLILRLDPGINPVLI